MRGRSSRPRKRRLGRHPIASVGARAARRHAIFHPVERLAARSARAADLGALAADMLVMGGLARHEVDRDRANLRAVSHDLHVLGVCVLAAGLQAMVHRHVKAGHMTFVASVHAGLHVGVHLMHLSFSVDPRPP